jgi:pimeloyl-ACP methyl ester carboxylesterase
MPTMSLPPGLELFYQIDDFTDPWRAAEPVVLLHGFSESGDAWRAWVPYLARRYRVVRPDQRGFGRSTPMARDFPWTLDILIDDLVRFAAALNLTRFHLVAAKIGGTLSLRLAAKHPELLKSLTVLGVPPAPKQTLAPTMREWAVHMEQRGVRSWAKTTMRPRLGSNVSQAHLDGWTDLMAATALSTQLGFMQMTPGVDVLPDLGHIRCPTLVVTTTGSGLGSVAETESWQKLIPGSELLVIEGDSYHVAASDPDTVAPAVRAFLDRHSEIA